MAKLGGAEVAGKRGWECKDKSTVVVFCNSNSECEKKKCLYRYVCTASIAIKLGYQIQEI